MYSVNNNLKPKIKKSNCFISYDHHNNKWLCFVYDEIQIYDINELYNIDAEKVKNITVSITTTKNTEELYNMLIYFFEYHTTITLILNFNFERILTENKDIFDEIINIKKIIPSHIMQEVNIITS